MKQYILIEADTNDGDYIMRKTEISNEDLEMIKPVIEAIKNFEPYKGKEKDGYEWNHSNNFPMGDCVREHNGQLSAQEYYKDKVTKEQLNIFMEFIPYGEYGFHTIESIELIIVAEEIQLL